MLFRSQRLAIQGILYLRWKLSDRSRRDHRNEPSAAAGFRDAEHVEGTCDYVNDNWGKSPLHLASYVMWRLNWIHPFTGGNGRTSRAVSYLVLCARLGYRLVGTNTIPEQIVANREPYYSALDAADLTGNIDVTLMEALLEWMLAVQLSSVLADASARVPPPAR